MFAIHPKILMFGWEFPPFNSGGLGTACYGLTRSLAKKGAKIHFVLPKKLDVRSDHVAFTFADNGHKGVDEFVSRTYTDVLLYPYITEERYYTDHSFLHRLQPHVYAGDLYHEVMRYAKLAQNVAQDKTFDIIHAHDWLTFPAGIEAKKISNKKFVAHVHATEYDRSGGNGANQQVFEIEKEGLQQADKVIAVSNHTKQVIVRQYGINPQKIAVVHNGIDEDYFQQYALFHNTFCSLKKNGHKIVLFLGRLTIQKGPDYFIRAAKIVLKYVPEAMFVVAGSGDMEQRMIHLAAELGIADKVLFTGWLRGRGLQQVYQAADLYIMPSISEPFGLTALESMLNGTPVIVSKQTGVSETVTNVLKVDFWDVDEIANKIVAVLQYTPLQQCLSQEGRIEVKTKSWRHAAEKCLAVYQQLLFQPS